MFFDAFAGSWQLQLWGAQMVGQLRLSGAKDRLDSRVADVIGTPFDSRYFPVTPLMPAWYYAFQNGTLVVVIDGSTTISQGIALVNGYGSSTVGKSVPGINPYLSQSAISVIQEIRERGTGNPSRIVLFGHSLGGAIAQAMHWLLIRDGFNLVTTSITYGSPRVGDEGFTRLMANADTCRLMNALDPVPLVPPQEGEAPYVRLITPSEQLAQWNRHIHSDGGAVVTADGRRYGAILPSGALLNPLTSLASWLASLPTAAETVHSIATYEANINAYGLVAGPSSVAAVPDSGTERTHSQTAQEINKEKELAADAVNAQAHTQLSAPLRVPKAFLFTARPQGKVWVVFFQRHAIALGPGKAAAKKLAMNGNRFASSMLRSGSVDTESVLNGFLEWFGFAESPGSGISPTLVSSV